MISILSFILETLPKPYVPSAVPFFTGREAEVKEIINLITDQSTRLLNIWGSPGFGKTSTAIGAAHHLVSLEYPVYFFKLHGITTMEGFLSKILGIFKSNLVDHDLKPIDKVVSIFREISGPIFLIFDNLDDLLLSESCSAKLRSVFEELLNSSVSIKIMFTTREQLENLRDHIEGFQDIRIRPLHPVSSIAFVRQLLPAFSENVVAQVAEICSHVPLAIKLVASIVRNNTEDMADKIVKELSLSGDLLGKIDSPYEENMKKLFELLFEQLTLSDKHALISLTVFSSSKICKNAAVKVVSGDAGVVEAIRSLKTLVNKSFADEDCSGETYSLHPLIYSFVVDKAKQSDFENIFNSSNTRFCNYYLLLFEEINDDFLAGKPIESPKLQDTMDHLLTVMHESLTIALQDLVCILSKSEIFLFLMCFPWASPTDISELYDLAIEKCSAQQYDCSKLNVSKYFLSSILSLFVSNIDPHLHDRTRDAVLSSCGSVAKLACYEGLSLFAKGERKPGVEQIEKHLDKLESCSDQQLIKCLCSQLLALYYANVNEYGKSDHFRRKAIKVCEEIGSYNLFLINNCEEISLPGQNECKGEQIMFLYLLCLWSKKILSVETAMHFSNLLHILEQGLENKPHHDSHYLFSMFMYHDCLLAILGKISGEESLLDEKINFLDRSLNSELIDRTFPRLSEAENRSTKRLLHCYYLKMAVDKDKIIQKDKIPHTVEMCRKALKLSLEQHGKKHEITASWYLKVGLAEKAAENFNAALEAFDEVFEIGILETVDIQISSKNHIVADAFVGRAEIYKHMGKFKLAIESFKEALRIKRKLSNEDTEGIANVLNLLGDAQWYFKEFRSALATFEQALEILLKLHAGKRCSSCSVVRCYLNFAQVHQDLGNNTECVNALKTALEINKDCNDKFAQCLILFKLVKLKEDENLYMEMFKNAARVIEEEHKPVLGVMHLILASKHLESGKHVDGVASLQEAFSIKLDDIMLTDVVTREDTVGCCTRVAKSLVKIGRFKLAERTIDRATSIVESLPECKQHFWEFRCFALKGHIHNAMREHVVAVKSFDRALLLLPELSPDAIDKYEEYSCHMGIAVAYFYQKSYKKALSVFFKALPIIKHIFPEGCLDEADLYRWVAAIASKIKNKSLELNNLRLGYKLYKKMLGSNHILTERYYIAYVRALINQDTCN